MIYCFIIACSQTAPNTADNAKQRKCKHYKTIPTGARVRRISTAILILTTATNVVT